MSMIEKYLLQNLPIKMILDDEIIEANYSGCDYEGVLFASVTTYTRAGIIKCHEISELDLVVQELNQKLIKSNDFKFFVDGEEI